MMMIQCNMILLIFMLFPIPTCIQQIPNKFNDCPLDAKQLPSNQLPNPETWEIYDKFAGRKPGLLQDSTPSPIILYA